MAGQLGQALQGKAVLVQAQGSGLWWHHLWVTAPAVPCVPVPVPSTCCALWAQGLCFPALVHPEPPGWARVWELPKGREEKRGEQRAAGCPCSAAHLWAVSFPIPEHSLSLSHPIPEHSLSLPHPIPEHSLPQEMPDRKCFNLMFSKPYMGVLFRNLSTYFPSFVFLQEKSASGMGFAFLCGRVKGRASYTMLEQSLHVFNSCFQVMHVWNLVCVTKCLIWNSSGFQEKMWGWKMWK